MECPNCKKQLADNAKTCPDCGYDFTEKENREASKATLGCLGLIIIVVAILVTSCVNSLFSDESSSNKSNNSTSNKIQQEKIIQTNVETGTEILKNNITQILNKGFTLDGEAYYTKSNDYQNAYFIGAVVKEAGKKYNCIWFSDSTDMSGMTDSANDNAIKVSGLPDGRTASYHISEADDGYSRIEEKLNNL